MFDVKGRIKEALDNKSSREIMVQSGEMFIGIQDDDFERYTTAEFKTMDYAIANAKKYCKKSSIIDIYNAQLVFLITSNIANITLKYKVLDEIGTGRKEYMKELYKRIKESVDTILEEMEKEEK